MRNTSHDPPVAAQANPVKQKPDGSTEIVKASDVDSCATATAAEG
ncbi:MAG: hypothetical protein WBB68_03755 [Candidatus Moraniibacteriota bacterium]